jgi:uncharacterized protein
MELPSSDKYYKLSVDSFDTSTLLQNAARQRDTRGYDKFPIIDVDAHHYETDSTKEINKYITDPVLQQLAEGGRYGLTGGRIGFQDMGGRVTRYPLRRIEETPSDGKHRDVHLTHRWMDAMGVDYSCMFPTPMLGLGVHPLPEIEINMARAYNSWLVNEVLPGSNRIGSMLYLPMNDHTEAYKIVEEFADKPGVIGFMVTSVREKPVHANDYMKIYRAVEERGLPLAFHGGFNWSDPLLRNTNRFISVHALGFVWYNVVHLTNWVINGLCERFPNLPVIWIESGLAWVPWLMQRLDNEFKMRSSEAPLLKKMPSDYMRDMYYSSQPMEIPDDLSILETTFKMIDAENQLLYASDYPHWDMDLPSTIYDLPFLSEKAKRKILGENAIKLFNLDVSETYPGWKPYEEETAAGKLG